MRRPLLARPGFYPAVVALSVLGALSDLIGTYLAQPNFEYEANPVVMALRHLGLEPTWTGAILGKAIIIGLALWGMRGLLQRRREHYPSPGKGLREFLTAFLYGREMTWFEATYRRPRDPRPALWFIGAGVALAWPFFLYLGYENLAAVRGWPTFPAWWIGPVYVDLGALITVVGAALWLCGQLYADYRSVSGAN